MEGVAKDGRSGTDISNLIVVPIKNCKSHHLIGLFACSFVVYVVVRFMLFWGIACGMGFLIHRGWEWQKMTGKGWSYHIKELTK